MRRHTVLSLAMVAVLTTAPAIAAAADPEAGPLPRFFVSEQPQRNDVALFVDQSEIRPELFRLLKSARQRIQIDYFLISGDIGMAIARVLGQKAAEGVDVRVVMDSKRGIGGPLSAGIAKVIDYLQAHQVPVRLYPIHLFGTPPNGLQRKIQIDHNKLLVVDGETAYMGSMNLHDRAMNNHDLMIRVEGPTAAEVSRMMDADWPLATAPDGAPIRPGAAPPPARAVPPRGQSWLRLTQTAPQEKPTKAMLLKELDGAQRSVHLAMYLMAEPDLIAAVGRAAQRGLDVRVILDPRHASPVKYGTIGRVIPNGMPNLLAARELLAAGARVHWFVPTLPEQESHMKALLIDGKRLVAGSTNWTINSFTRWRETGFVLEGPPVATFAAMFERDWQRSEACTRLSVKQRLVARLVDFLNRRDLGFW